MSGGSMLSSLFEMLGYDFILRAFFAGLIIAFCSALIGSSLVLRKQSMIGDGLSHVAFGAAAIATVLGFAPIEFSIPIVIIAAILILRLNQNARINGDAAIAVLSASALALGTFFISINQGTNIDLNSYLFGSILAITTHDLILCIILGTIITIAFLLLRRQIFAITFDEKFAKAIGIKVDLYNTILAILCSLIVVVGMRMLGALLISSLIIFPCLSALQLSKTFRQNTIIAVILSIFCFIIGFTASYILNTPTGATIVLTNLIVLILCWIYNKLR
jgi:zinc transport system permease protein